LEEESGEVWVYVKIVREAVADLDGTTEALDGGTPEEGVTETVVIWAVAERAGEESH
jgi:hypothetical protein